MAILSFIKAWGPYKPGDILSSHSVPTIKVLTETYRVAVMLDRLPVIAKFEPEITLEPESVPIPEPEPETEAMTEIADDFLKAVFPENDTPAPAPVPISRKRSRKPRPKPE